MKDEFNPFVVTGYYSSEFFCGRESEKKQLISNLKNNLNTTLFAKRRLGKTGLIKHIFQTLANSKTVCIYVDISSTNNLNEFINEIATAVYRSFPEEKTIGKKIISAIKLLRPIISFDELTGNPVVSIEPGQGKKSENNLHQIFSFLDQQGIKIVFALDEFQQILSYPEKNIEAILRSQIQHLKNIHFIFSGSNQLMMHEIFNQAKRPFYASCSNLQLGLIHEKDYADFITAHFKKNRQTLLKEGLSFILEFTLQHTFYTQYLCNYIYSKKYEKIDLMKAQESAADVLKIFEPIFFQYRNLLTEAQWKLLRAIAHEEKAIKIHSREFIRKYDLGTSSMVTRGIQSLLEKEIIYQELNTEKTYYEVYDKFLMRWLQRK